MGSGAVGDHVPGDAWPEERLDAAFRAIAAREAPAGLEARVLARLDARPSRRWLVVPGLAAAGLVAVVLAAVAGPALLGGIVGPLTGSVTVRDGEAGTRVLDAGEFSFAFPAEWSVADSAASFSGGSSIAVLGTLPVDPRCGTGHVDINCVYEQHLEPGTVRAWVGTAAYRSGSILDEPQVDGSWEALTVDGMPALLVERTITPDDYYGSDLELTLRVARPAGFGQTVTIELRARDPGADGARATLDNIIASFRFVAPPATLPADDAAGEEVARRVLAESDEVLRQSIGEGSGATPYSCQPLAPGDVAETELGYDFTSSLGGTRPARCSWLVERHGNRFWQVTVSAEWDVGEHEDAGTEAIWVDAAGNVMGRRVDQRSATPTAPPATAAPVRGVESLSIRADVDRIAIPSR